MPLIWKQYMKSSKIGKLFGHTKLTYPISVPIENELEKDCDIYDEAFRRKSFRIMFSNCASAENCREAEIIDKLIDEHIAEDCLTEFWNGLWTSVKYLIRSYIVNEKLAQRELKTKLINLEKELQSLKEKYRVAVDILED